MDKGKYNVDNFREQLGFSFMQPDPETGRFPDGTTITHLMLFPQAYPHDKGRLAELAPIVASWFGGQIRCMTEAGAALQQLVVYQQDDEGLQLLDDYRKLYKPVEDLDIRVTPFEEHKFALRGMRRMLQVAKRYLRGVDDRVPQSSFWVINRPADEVTGTPAERMYVEMNYERSEDGEIHFMGGQAYRNPDPDHPVVQWCESWMAVYNDQKRSQPLFPEQSH